MANTILIIDDEVKLRTLLAKMLSLEGFDVLQAGDGKTGLKKLEQQNIDIVLCDVKLPDEHGVDLAKNIKQKYPALEIILMTAYGNIPDSVQAIKNGAFDYITKGDDNYKIIPLLYRALEKVKLAKRVQQLEKQLDNKYALNSILGCSKSIQLAIEAARKVAQTDATVLLTGETGTGKEVFAQAIHQAGKRKNGNFIAVNCSAFSKELLENELFGHKAGAFTGAIKDTKGIFEEANEGTIFLDEIGEMPLDLQAKLLRVIETGEFLKVGDNNVTRVNVRLIAATNRDLKKEVNAGRFREDLFYRISVFQIQLPSLRERIDDITLLANHFLQYFSEKTNKKITGIAPAYIQLLQKHTWKGNIRELKNIIERSVILTENNILEPASLPVDFYQVPDLQMGNVSAPSLALADVEKAHIQKVLQYTGGNKTETARLLNIALTTLYRKIEEYKITSSVE
ncbi:MAG: response regulator [Hydrotalea flava]|uniref:sigma-54-dependent transcriptional regulator n=2 Tax=Hydrotalea TaxID=1004300 RepID=UPI0016901406|nr:sigma-54 dependent transcriptional regulator [Hydrotalea lipotrueae]NIM35406.1 response regulator [Hydrotalea flava]NIM38265.1 response regulator [Hydrotalea flava]NIN03435.1 response regulator [Hydrotalea flava]NIN15123.1 response regulator [Hydrotalea flava]NIO94191.1 response regulator [Hydrotalea flava]